MSRFLQLLLLLVVSLGADSNGIASAGAAPKGDGKSEATAPQKWFYLNLQVGVTGHLRADYYHSENLPAAQVDSTLSEELGCSLEAEREFSKICSSAGWGGSKSSSAPPSRTISLAKTVLKLKELGSDSIQIYLSGRSAVVFQVDNSSGSTTWKDEGKKNQNLSFVDNGLLPTAITARLQADLASPIGAIVCALSMTLLPLLVMLWARLKKQDPFLIGVWFLTCAWFFWAWASGRYLPGLFTWIATNVSASLSILIGAAMLSALVPVLAIAFTISFMWPEDDWRVRLSSLMEAGKELFGWGLFFGLSSLAEIADFSFSWAIAAGFGSYKAIAWLQKKANLTPQPEMTELIAGDLLAACKRLAEKAGVTLAKVFVYRERSQRELNAAALGHGRMMFGRSLLSQLTGRETEAVIAHELAHLKNNDPVVQGLVGLLCIALYFGAAFASPWLHLPNWFPTFIPILILTTYIQTRISRWHEFRADRVAVEITGDAEAQIACLGRLAIASKTPLDWNPLGGAILTHPSHRQRALEVAKSFSIDPERALKVLSQPDLLEEKSAGVAETKLPVAVEMQQNAQLTDEAAAPESYASIDAVAAPEQVFSEESEVAFTNRNLKRSDWAMLGFLTVGLVLGFLLYVLSSVGSIVSLGEIEGVRQMAKAALPFVLTYVAILSIAAAFFLTQLTEFLDRRHFRQNAMRLRDIVKPPDNAVFVHFQVAQHRWLLNRSSNYDFGFLWFSPERMHFVSQKHQIEIDRADVLDVRPEKGMPGWVTTHALTVHARQGSFQFRQPDLVGAKAAAGLYLLVHRFLNHALSAEEISAAPLENRALEGNQPAAKLQKTAPLMILVVWVMFSFKSLMKLALPIALISAFRVAGTWPLFLMLPASLAPLVWFWVFLPPFVASFFNPKKLDSGEAAVLQQSA